MVSRSSALLRPLLLVLLCTAFWLRIHDLATAPPGLYYDEAAHGLDALQVWQGHLHIFFPTANGHEPIFTYLVAGFVRVLGNTILAVRLPAALLGVLAVTAGYALGRRLLGPWPALLAAGLIAGTFWTVALSRIGYRANTLPVLFPIWLLAYWRCRNRHDWGPYLLAGGLLGLTQYTYTAARFLPLLALILAFDWRRTLSIRGLIVGAAAVVLATAPLVVAILLDPDTGTERIRDAWLFSRPEPWALLGRQLVGHLRMFGFSGDPLWIHNIPFRPPIALPVAALLGLGVILGWRRPATRALTLAVAVLLWPGILAVSNNPAPPDHLRVLVTATAVFLLVAAGVAWVSHQRIRMAIPLALALVLFDGVVSWRDYARWSSARETYEQFDADMTGLAKKIVAHPDLFYLIPLSPDWHEFEPGRHWTIDYLSGYRQNYRAITLPYQVPELTADQVALVTWLAGMHLEADPQHILAGELNLTGYTKTSEEIENTYALDFYTRSGRPVEIFRFAPQHIYTGGLQITELNLYHKRPAAGQPGKLMAEVVWQSAGPYAQSLAVSLRLQTADGAPAGQVDSALWNELGETAEEWRTPEHSRLFLELETTDLSPGVYTITLLPYATDNLQPLPPPAGHADGTIGTVELRE